jgi:hypothetical protein
VNEEVVTALKNAIPPILKSLFSATTTLTELIPLLMRIISPPLKPVRRLPDCVFHRRGKWESIRAEFGSRSMRTL